YRGAGHRDDGRHRPIVSGHPGEPPLRDPAHADRGRKPSTRKHMAQRCAAWRVSDRLIDGTRSGAELYSISITSAAASGSRNSYSKFLPSDRDCSSCGSPATLLVSQIL